MGIRRREFIPPIDPIECTFYRKLLVIIYRGSEAAHSSENDRSSSSENQEKGKKSFLVKRKLNVFIDGTVIECGSYQKTVMEIVFNKNPSFKLNKNDTESHLKHNRKIESKMQSFLDQ